MKNILLIIASFLLLISCKTVTKTIEVPVEVEVIKKEYIHDTRIDSVYIRDSIDRWLAGDTVYIAKYSTKYKYVNKTDTVIKNDTIPKIVTVTTEKQVEVNHIYWYQKLLMWLGSIMTLLLVGFIIYKVKFK